MAFCMLPICANSTEHCPRLAMRSDTTPYQCPRDRRIMPVRIGAWLRLAMKQRFSHGCPVAIRKSAREKASGIRRSGDQEIELVGRGLSTLRGGSEKRAGLLRPLFLARAFAATSITESACSSWSRSRAFISSSSPKGPVPSSFFAGLPSSHRS